MLLTDGAALHIITESHVIHWMLTNPIEPGMKFNQFYKYTCLPGQWKLKVEVT